MQVEYADGEPETYVVPLTVAADLEAEQIASDHPNAGVAWIDVAQWGQRLLLFDATADDGFLDAAIRQFKRSRSFDSNGGAELRTSTTPELRRIVSDGTRPHGGPHVGRAEQHLGGVRQPGRDEGLPSGPGGREPRPRDRPLPHRARASTTARRWSARFEYQKGRTEPRTIGVINRYVPNEGDAWHYTLDALGLFYESALADVARRRARGARLGRSLLDAAAEPLPDHAVDAIGPYLDSAEMLGRRTAELHQVLALGDSEEFEPEPFTTLYQRSLYQSMRAQVRPTLSLIRRMLPRRRRGRCASTREYVLDNEAGLLAAFDAVRQHRIDASRIRVHGDYHLGQVLHAGTRLRHHRLRGRAVAVAHRAPHQAGRPHRRGRHRAVVPVRGRGRAPRPAGARPRATRSVRRARDPWPGLADLGHRSRSSAPTSTRPTAIRSCRTDPADTHALLTAYVLDKALYEVRYDLDHRPDWAPIPLRGVASMLQSLEP